MRTVLVITILFGLLSCNRKDSITKFSEEHTMDKEYYIYPSTLRMMNIEANEEYNELIEDLVLGQYFSLALNDENFILIKNLKEDMDKEGYEEAMVYRNKEVDATIYILQNEIPKIAAFLKEDSTINIIQVEGLINITRIPALLENMDNSGFNNLLEILQKDQNRRKRGHHS